MEGHRSHADEQLSGLQSWDRGFIIEDQSFRGFTLAHDSPSSLRGGDKSTVGDIGGTGGGHFSEIRVEGRRRLAISPYDPFPLYSLPKRSRQLVLLVSVGCRPPSNVVSDGDVHGADDELVIRSPRRSKLRCVPCVVGRSLESARCYSRIESTLENRSYGSTLACQRRRP
jgi:hypothetical protein